MRVVHSVRGRSQFAGFRNARHRARADGLRVVFVPNADFNEPHVAYAISRKVGNAVVRNRIRRRLRALCASPEVPLLNGSYLFTVSPDAANSSFDELRTNVNAATSRIVDQVQA